MDLKAFLSRAEPYGHFRWQFTYFSALHGLASALTRAHEVRVSGDGADFDGIGYHHDLRPANVLVSSVTFLLADFGMGRVRELEDGSTTRFKAVRGDYAAPECMDEDYAPLDVGRAIDVWALGCLMSEVMTYACLGVEGLNRFRNLRKVAKPSGDKDSFFHGIGGRVKTEVTDWLNYLASEEHEHPPALDVPLRDLLLSIFTPASSRPNVGSICQSLAHLSLKAHFLAVLDSLAKVINGNNAVLGGVSLMRLWFERERLQAFGTVLRLPSPTLDDTVAKFAVQYEEICIPVLFHLFNKVNRAAQGATGETDAAAPGQQIAMDADSGGHNAIAHPLVGDVADDRTTLEADAQRLVQQLWNLLSEADSRKAERIWVHSMLDATDSIEKLGKIERNLGAQRSVAYQQGAAMAAMKKIRLEILHGSGSEEGLDKLEIPERDTPRVDLQLTHGHRMGVYKTTSRVLIESVFYDPSWEKVPPEERTIVMAHKANGFNAKPQPPALRLLKCLGFFEKKTDRSSEGFSFVYLVPEPTEGLDPAITPSERSVMTLNGLLLLSIRAAKKSKVDQYMTQPILCDKFRLASVLADFLTEFHTIGWLHENFHSNNIVFFNMPPGLKDNGISPVTSSILHKPFIVGLNKSRPGGKGWHTQGPSAETDFLDYRHPAYQQTGHFRVGYDYYSLGVMLLEIGLWVPLSAIACLSEYRTMSPSELHDMLVTRYVPRLGCKMGRVYQDVVYVLLSDRLDPNPEREFVDHRQESLTFSRFVEDVVGPLNRLASNI
jgi:serine/threonine protein kinase